MKKRKKSLIQELKWTILGLSATMLAMWFLFYVNIHSLIQSYVMQNMEQVSEQIISEMNRSFLQLEEVSFALSQDTRVQEFVLENNYVQFVNQAADISDTIEALSEDSSFMDNLIIYNGQSRYYRFSGNISNTGVQRLMNVANKEQFGSHIQVHLDETDYIGYVTAIYQDKKQIGGQMKK